MKAVSMKFPKFLSLGLLLMFLMPAAVTAQGFGDYGRTLGGVTQRQGSMGPGVPQGRPQTGTVESGRIGDSDGRGVPSRLIVSSKQAVLFPRQDDEAEKILSLEQGEILVPILQAAGASEWYMVKTQKGVIGWIKSSDVQEHSQKSSGNHQ
jgi:hypothetical protein